MAFILDRQTLSVVIFLFLSAPSSVLLNPYTVHFLLSRSNAVLSTFWTGHYREDLKTCYVTFPLETKGFIIIFKIYLIFYFPAVIIWKLLKNVTAHFPPSTLKDYLFDIVVNVSHMKSFLSYMVTLYNKVLFVDVFINTN